MIEQLQKYMPNVFELGLFGDQGWLTAIGQTFFMVFWSALIGGSLGLLAGIILVLTDKGGIRENNIIFQIVDKLVSIMRAIPFIILLAFIAPLTRQIVGTTIGTTAALVPLSLAVFPFFARQVQVSLAKVNHGIIEAGQAIGSNLWDLIIVYLSEARSELIRVATITLISLIGETAMAGAIGAGGLGTTAVVMGYSRWNNDITIVATIVIILIVFAVQLIGDKLNKRLSHN
jgi:D-methionine transport system permease protein